MKRKDFEMLYFILAFMMALAAATGLPMPPGPSFFRASNDAVNIDLLFVSRYEQGVTNLTEIVARATNPANAPYWDFTKVQRRTCLDNTALALVRFTPRDGYTLGETSILWGDAPVPQVVNAPAGQFVPVFHYYNSSNTRDGFTPVAVFANASDVLGKQVQNQLEAGIEVHLCKQRVNLGGYIARTSSLNFADLTNFAGVDFRACHGQVTSAVFSAEPAPGVNLKRAWVFFGDSADQSASSPAVVEFLNCESGSCISPGLNSDQDPSADIRGVSTHVYNIGSYPSQTFIGALFYEEDTGEIGQESLTIPVVQCPDLQQA